MRFVWSSVRWIGELPSRKSAVFVALFGLMWIAPAPGRIESTALSAHEPTSYRNQGDTPEYAQRARATGEAENWGASAEDSVEDFIEDSDFSASAAVSTEYYDGTEYPESEYSEPELDYSDSELEYPESEYPEPEYPEPEYSESIAQLDYETGEDSATNSENEVVSSESSENNTAPPPEPTEWIAAWVDDLKQSSQRWIEVDLSNQQILAWEGDTVVFSAPVSTGREGDWTPPGVYAIEIKYDKAWMQGDDYEIPNVPYVMYFFGSYAIHGAYWRDNFGTPASRGCVSMSVDQAEWLYSWATEGTHVVIEQ